MAILAAFMVPHPPMIVPAVGRGSESQIAETTKAYEQVAKEIAQIAPETIIITNPHAVMYEDYFHISPGRRAKGSFAGFRAPQVAFNEDYDTELVDRICDLADDAQFPAGTLGERKPDLDHGTMVPLWFIRQKYLEGKIVRIGLSGLPLTDHYRLGQILSRAAEDTGRRVVLVASGDLSHKLQAYGPYGFSPDGPVYDRRIMDVCGRAAFGELLEFDEDFCDRAAECGHRSFVIMAGAFDGMSVKATALSHQDVTGVGYGICTFYPDGEDEKRHFLADYEARVEEECRQKAAQSDPYVRLARAAVEEWVLRRKVLRVEEGIAEAASLADSEGGESGSAKATAEFASEENQKRDPYEDMSVSDLQTRRAGAFVSLHKNGQLRGCIGTIQATRASLAEEIIQNAISACSRDPRFSPVTANELKFLEISVDVLGEAEEIDGPGQLDVRRYGVIVSCGQKRGLLLPDLEGVDTVEEQIRIARQKGGIRETDPYRLERFEVVRHL